MSKRMRFNPVIALVAGLIGVTTVWSQTKDTAPPTTRAAFTPPLETDIPEDPFGALVLEGRALFMDSARLMPRYVGNVLTCASCHLDRGRMAGSAPMWASLPMFPAYRSKNDKVNTFVERMQGCFQFSMNGTPPPSDSREILALTVYSHWMATGAPVGIELEGRGYALVPQPAGGHDIDRGKQLYAGAACHWARAAPSATSRPGMLPRT